MTSHQTQPSLNSLPGHLFAKRSNSNFETSKPPLKSWRTVGGIDESPLHPKHTQHATSATHLLNSRFLNKTSFQHPSSPQFAVSRRVVTARNASNSLSFIRTHKSTLSDSSFVHLNGPPIPTHHHTEIPSFVDQTTAYQPPSSHSVVASLGLAPISNSIPSRHPFNLRPLRTSKDPSNNSHSPYLSPGSTPNSIDPFLSFPQLPSIPSILNPARASPFAIDQPYTHNDDDLPSDPAKFTPPSFHDTHVSPQLSLEIKAFDQPPASSLPFPARSHHHSIHPRPTRTSPPIAAQPKICESPPIAGMSDEPVSGGIEPSFLPVESDSPEKRAYRPDGTCLLFEPAGKAFIKYACPRPRLNANKLAQRINLTEQPLIKSHNRDAKKFPSRGNNPGISVSKHLREISADSPLEELRDRYWNSKDHYYDANQVWAEIYISKLERKIWKSEAEAEISVDCFKFCTPLGSHNKSKKLHRRTISAPNLKHTPKSTSLLNIDHCGSRTRHGSSAPLLSRCKPDRLLRKPCPVSKTPPNLITSCPSTPFNNFNGSLNGFSCINPKKSSSISRTDSNAPKSGLTARHRASSAPRPLAKSRMATVNGPKVILESGYRIIIPNAPNSAVGNSKTRWRRSRSVPNLREKSSSGFDSSRDTPERPDPNSSINTKIPQSLLDAMFPPPPGSKENPSSFSSEKLPSVQSPPPNLIRTSEYATIETHADNPSSCNPDFPSEITQATQSGSKGPLHSLPRFIEPRSTAIIALPPPPRKRTLTPVASPESTMGTSLHGTKHSTSQSSPSHTSWGTPSQKTHPKSSSSSSSRLDRRFSPTPIIPSHFPQATTEHSGNSLIAFPSLSASMFQSGYMSRPPSLSNNHQISPSIESAMDSVKRLSGFVSDTSSPPCSLDLKPSSIDDEYRFGSLNIAPYKEPPLSAFRFAKLTPQHDSTRIASQEDHVPNEDAKNNSIATDTRPYPAAVAFTPCSSVSSPSRSSLSVIDPDKYIDQADLFYQIPTSPQRDLIEDYDNHIFKSMQTLDNLRVSSLSSSTYGAQSRLIDQILTSYDVTPRKQKSFVSNRHHEETNRAASEVVSTKTENQHSALTPSKPDSHPFPTISAQTLSTSTLDERIPKIVDAFEARLWNSIR